MISLSINILFSYQRQLKSRKIKNSYANNKIRVSTRIAANQRRRGRRSENIRRRRSVIDTIRVIVNDRLKVRCRLTRIEYLAGFRRCRCRRCSRRSRCCIRRRIHSRLLTLLTSRCRISRCCASCKCRFIEPCCRCLLLRCLVDYSIRLLLLLLLFIRSYF